MDPVAAHLAREAHSVSGALFQHVIASEADCHMALGAFSSSAEESSELYQMGSGTAEAFILNCLATTFQVCAH